jgi:phospholipid/cholesterol/gamma-HCH transport system permease protein
VIRDDDRGVGEMRLTAEERLVATPGYTRLESLAGMAELCGSTIRAAVRPPYPWVRDFVHECALTIRRSIVPLVLSMSAFSIGIVVALIAGLLEAIGTIDRAGGGNITGWTREPGYWVTSMIFAGVVGSAITADLGARKVREELDAMRVLAIDPIKKLVVPRVLALAVMAPVLGLLAVLDAMAVSYFAYPMLLPNSTQAAFRDSTVAFMNSADLISLMAKLVVTGLFVGIVCCYKGLSAKGGAEGVGRAVNQAVLITFFWLWVLNSLWNAVFLANVPAVGVLRG